MGLNKLAATAAVWSRQQAELAGQAASADDHDTHTQPLLTDNERIAQPTHGHRYGAVDVSASSLEHPGARRNSPQNQRNDYTLNRVPEELDADDDGQGEADATAEVEWDLEERGFYPGSYRRVLALYSLVPITAAVLLIFLALAPVAFWESGKTPAPPHPPYYPIPVPEVLLSSALWALAYLARAPLYSATSIALVSLHPFFIDVAFNLIHAVLFNLLRISSLPLLGLRQQMQHARSTWHDQVFIRVWWLSLGWAIIDVIVGIAQSYSQIALYRSALVPEDKVADVLGHASGQDSQTNILNSSDEHLPLSPRQGEPAEHMLIPAVGKPSVSGVITPLSINEAIRLAVDQDLEQLVNLKEREDLEEIYGFPVIKIPVFVSCLQRIDSILLSTGNTLVLSAAYLNSHLSLSDTSTGPSTNRPFFIAFPLILLMNVTMSLLHTPSILPRIGVHTTAYIGFVLGLGSFFTGLGLWGALA